MTPGDKALESIIAQLTSAIAMTHDPRLVRLQQQAVAMRSEAQVQRMACMGQRNRAGRL